jgi:hypothetical protein
MLQMQLQRFSPERPLNQKSCQIRAMAWTLHPYIILHAMGKSLMIVCGVPSWHALGMAPSMSTTHISRLADIIQHVKTALHQTLNAVPTLRALGMGGRVSTPTTSLLATIVQYLAPTVVVVGLAYTLSLGLTCVTCARMVVTQACLHSDTACCQQAHAKQWRRPLVSRLVHIQTTSPTCEPRHFRRGSFGTDDVDLTLVRVGIAPICSHRSQI